LARSAAPRRRETQKAPLHFCIAINRLVGLKFRKCAYSWLPAPIDNEAPRGSFIAGGDTVVCMR